MDPKLGSPSNSDADNETPNPPDLSQIDHQNKALTIAQSQNDGSTNTECRIHADIKAMTFRGCTETECRTHARINAMTLGGQFMESLPGHVTERFRVPAIDTGKGEVVENPDTPVEIIVNHFPVYLEEKPTFIYRYRVSLFPSCESKSVKRRLKSLLQENFFGGDLIGHDGAASIFIAESTLKKKGCLGRTDFEIMISPWTGERPDYTMNLKKIRTLSDNRLREFLRGYEQKPSSKYLQALEVVLKDGPSSLPFALNNAAYYLDEELVALKLGSDGDPMMGDGGGQITSFSIWALKGFVQKLRAVKRGLTLNLDSVSMAFHARKCLIHYLQGRGIDPLALLHSQEQMVKAKEMLVGLYVDVMHSPTRIYRKYRIADISAQPASECYILHDGGDRTNVVEYFRTWDYVAITVDPNLPCVVVRGGEDSYGYQEHDGWSDPGYLPMEVCFIAVGQKYVGDRNIGETLKELAGRDAMGRYQTIQKNFKFLKNLFQEQVIHNQNFRSINPFGISIGEEMISVVGRLIPEPRLASNAKRAEFSRGKWKLKRVFKSGRSLKADEWDVILIGPVAIPSNQVKATMNDIFSTFSRMGINCLGDHAGRDRDYDLWIDTSHLSSSAEVETAFRSLTKKYSSRLLSISFLFIIFHEKIEKFFYETLKRMCNIEMGWITQCCLLENFNRSETGRSRGLYAIPATPNIAMKVNIKLGGVNTVLMENEFLESLFGSEERVILFGTHLVDNASESPENGMQSPSNSPKSRRSTLAVMVASMEWPIPGKYYARVRHLPRKPDTAQIADSLSAMAKELLETHIDENQGKMPTRAIFFKDGVPDGEFKSLAEKQFLALKQGLQSICPGIKASLIVSQRTHDTRFFIKKRDEDGNEVIQNIETGTVVDKDITQPQLVDFYLLSESAQRSLPQPTHYFLVADENDLGTNLKGLERFVFYLCYTYVRSTNTVPVVPPVLYASMAASHAGAWYSSIRDSAHIHPEPHPAVLNTMYFC